MAEPFRTESFVVEGAAGARIVGETYYPPRAVDEKRPTVILAHGWTLNRTLWSRVIRGIHARVPVRVVAYDQRGHGESSPGSGKASVGQLGDDLATVIAETTGGHFVLAGHSMGGMTVMAYAGRYPEDLLSRCAGVVLLGTAAADVKRPGWFGRVEMGVMHVAKRGPRIPAGIFVTNPHQRYLNFGDDADPRDVRLVRNAIAATKIRDMGNYFTALEELDESASLAMLGQIPTTIMVGTKDRLTPVHYARALHEGISGSRLIEIPGKGHMLGFEATAEVCDVIAHHVMA
jgi:pimeloyl-ACP methyl ester carboxylesterase